MSDAPLVALTGGTGFLGRHVAASLHAAGWRVRLLARRNPAHPLLASVPFEAVRGDLADAAALEQLVDGAEAVVHAAGLVRASSRADFLRVNATGSATLAAAIGRAAPAARRVMVSSQAARAPEVSDYAASKHAGEIAMRLAGPCLVLRPGVIYGPWDNESPALLRLGAAPLAPVPCAPEPRLTLVHVRDVAELITACCRPDAPTEALWEVGDGSPEGYGWREMLALLAVATGRPNPPLALPLPDAVFRLAGVAADVWSSLRRRPALFGRGKASEILHRDWAPDPTGCPPVMLWQPRIGATQGFAELALWVKAQAATLG